MTNVEVRSIIARVEDMTTANFDMLLEDETFKNMFHLLVKGKNANLKGQVIKLMTENDGYFQDKMKEYDRKLKGKVNVKEWVVHRELDRIIDRAYDGAWDALEAYNSEQGYTSQGRELKMLRHQMQQGDVSGSSETQTRLKKLHQMAK